jgi:hypothetical protein
VSLVLSADREGPPWPVPITLHLTCDGPHGLLPSVHASFACDPWFPAAHTAAMRAGWKETWRDGHPLWLGPCCSGKVPVSLPEG